MKQLKYFSLATLALFAMLFSVTLTSCSSDDDDDNVGSINDFYISCSLRGGGFDSQTLSTQEAQLNAAIAGSTMQGYTVDEAKYVFNNVVKEFKNEFSDGMSGLSEPLVITFYLKTTDGTTVSTSTLTVTQDGCK